MIRHVLLGPPQHGVTRHGAELAGPDRIALPEVGPRATALADVLAASPYAVHLHLTDHLLGDDPETVEAGTAVLGAAPVPVHLTLHDIPQEAEGAARYARRRETYRQLVALADSVQVCSEHERRLLADVCGWDSAGAVDASRFAVVRLPVDVAPVARRHGEPTIGVLGFVHPGKDPMAAVRLAVATGASVDLLGAVGPGHDDYADELRHAARDGGSDCRITGHLTEQEMDEAIGRVGVPLAPYRHISASGSIGRWIAAGRRPIVLRTPWADELASIAPGAVTVVDDAGLEAAVRFALDHPESTWHDADLTGLPTTADAARAQQAELETPHLDVVIPYYEDERRLQWVLDALAHQSYPTQRLHIVVADDGSELAPTLPTGVALVRQDDEGFRAAAARGLGARQGTAPYVLFLDGDTVPEPGYCQAMVTALGTSGRSLAVGRRLHADFTGYQGEEVTRWVRDSAPRTPARTLDSPAWLDDGYARTAGLEKAGPNDWRLVISAVLGVTRRLFDRLGGFDESLVGYGGEDWDLAYRAWNLGADLRHAPDAVAWHDGPDAVARDDFADLKEHEQLALAARIPQPLVRGRHAVWAQPRTVVVLGAPVPPVSALLAWCDSWLALGDVGIWLGEGDAAGEDPRIHSGAPPQQILDRAEFRIEVAHPVELLDAPGLLEAMETSPRRAPGIRAARTRDLEHPGVRLSALPDGLLGDTLDRRLDLEAHGRRRWA